MSIYGWLMGYQETFAEACDCQSNGDYDRAIKLLNKVLLEKPDFAPGWNNRGAMLQKLGYPFDALMSYQKAVEAQPDEASFLNNRGTTYLDLEDFQQAIDDFDRASFRSPRIAETKNNRGIALSRLLRIREAAEAYRAATSIRPDYADAHLGLAISLLKLGEYKEGWKEFEWRWKTAHLEARNLPYPKWDGDEAKSPNDGLMLYGEQGMGDDLQFMRYAALAKMEAWHGKVYVEVRHPLVRVAQTMKGIDGVLALGEKPPANIVTAAPLMSVPGLLWDKYPRVFSGVPYLFTDEYRVNIWREKLKALPPGFMIGICWAGMNREKNPGASSIDSRRSMALKQFEPLTVLQGVSWVSLQLGPPAQQIYEPIKGLKIGDWTSELYDFYDTATLIDTLDLIITVDTSVAHVAGALGKPVWMLSRYDGCWRWLMHREDTPWYPTMRIYNQEKPYDWGSPLAKMERDLKAILEDRKLKTVA